MASAQLTGADALLVRDPDLTTDDASGPKDGHRENATEDALSRPPSPKLVERVQNDRRIWPFRKSVALRYINIQAIAPVARHLAPAPHYACARLVLRPDRSRRP